KIATSLKLELGHAVNRAELIARVMTEFERLYAGFEAQGDLGPVVQEYNELCLNTGNKVRVLDPNGEYTGISRGINSMGELLVETEDGQMREVYAGEVSVRGIYGYV
ncbi:MAG: biotin--[Lachnospiraceae bacterium]|nr:biotin--[acetyl-CoA-carboxylase] ligase [Lachnospiraceae bacterium]